MDSSWNKARGWDCMITRDCWGCKIMKDNGLCWIQELHWTGGRCRCNPIALARQTVRLAGSLNPKFWCNLAGLRSRTMEVLWNWMIGSRICKTGLDWCWSRGLAQNCSLIIRIEPRLQDCHWLLKLCNLISSSFYPSTISSAWIAGVCHDFLNAMGSCRLCYSGSCCGTGGKKDSLKCTTVV